MCQLTAPQCRMRVPMEEVGRLLMAMAKRSTEQPSKEVMTAIAKLLPKQSTLKPLHADKVLEDLPIPPAPAIPPLPSKFKGLSLTINASKHPRSYKDALSREDHAEWQEAYLKEYLGTKSRDAMVYATPPPGTKLLGTLTRTEYKVGPDGVFDKRYAFEETNKLRASIMSSRTCTRQPSRPKKYGRLLQLQHSTDPICTRRTASRLSLRRNG